MSTSTLLMGSPVGWLRLVSEDQAVSSVLFVDGDPAPAPDAAEPAPVLVEAKEQLTAYFAGDLRVFDLPLSLHGSPFQLRVWQQLQRIPFGTTASYADVAAGIGMSPTASRAIGLANGANPIVIVVPCHRVIGSDGSLVGYGGGLPRKKALLSLESPTVQESLFDD